MAKKKQSEAPMEEELIEKDESGGVINQIWNFFSSMKLGIFLLIIIAIASIVGTLILKPDQYGNTDYNVFYGSLWFRSLLFLLTMNLFICSLSRFRIIMKAMQRPKADFKENFVTQLKESSSVKTNTTTTGAETIVEKALSGKGYRTESKKSEEKIFIAADKGRFGLWGSFLSHIAFVVIVLGAIIGNMFGFDGYMNAFEGETFSITDVRGVKNISTDKFFKVKVEDFRIDYRPNGMVKDYYSDLVVIDDGKEVLKKTIEVNDPLKYNGVVFYQSSYGQVTDIEGSFDTPAGEAQEFSTYEGGVMTIPGKGLQLKVAKFIPDYDPAYGTETKSLNPNNPAVVYAIFQGNQTIAMDVAKLNEPFTVEGLGEIKFTDFHFREYTGLQVKRDPGVPIVWLGCGLLVFGVTLSFAVQQRKIWAVISEVNGKAVVDMGGVTMKNKLSFRKEFDQIAENIRDSK